jgi:hypothetical protein
MIDINIEAHKYYENEVSNKPLTESAIVDAFIAGAEANKNDNKKRYVESLKSLDKTRTTFINMKLFLDWLLIVNAIRNCAGMKSIDLNQKYEK